MSHEVNEKNKKEVMDFLKNEVLATLATVTPKGKPDASCIYYVLDENNNLLFLTGKETTKCKDIENQNEVVLVLTNEHKKETLKIHAKCEIIADADLSTFVVNELAKKLNAGEKTDDILPVLQRKSTELVVIKVKPYQLLFSIFTEEGMRETAIDL